MLLRGWRGNDPTFELMDTPGLLDSAGDTADGANIKAIVTKLKGRKKVNAFLLVLNAANVRFSPQEAQVIEVLDRILSSPEAGSFLSHTIIVLNRADQEAYRNEEQRVSELVDKIKESVCGLRDKRKDEEDELQARVKALQMELDDMRLENRSKEGEMTRELDTRRGTIQELRLSIQRREQEIGESSTEVLKEPRRKVSVFKKSMSSSDVLSVEARSRTQTLASAYSTSTYNPASNPFYPSLDTAQTPAFTDGATGFTDGAAGFCEGAAGFSPATMAGINTILAAKSKLKER